MPQHRLRLAIVMAPLALLFTACAEGQTLQEVGADVQDGSAGGGGGGAPPLGVGGGDVKNPWDPGAPDGGTCSEVTSLIHVVSTAGDLYSFWPPTLQFHKVGHLDCPVGQGGFSPMSMAIDKQGIAHVLYWDGKVYDVDLETGACDASGFGGNLSSFYYFGMAYAADPASPSGETLFVREAAFYDAGSDPLVRKLARLDLATKDLEVVGSGEGANADLSGTGDGRLFAFVKNEDASASVTELDAKTGGALSVTPLDGVTIGDSWAFAHWGGDLWLFSGQEGQGLSVFQHELATGETTLVATQGFRIIGAGVSTCVPVEPPQ